LDDSPGNVVRGSLDLVRRVTDRDTATSPAQHFDVVPAIAERQHIGSRDTEARCHLGEPGRLVHAIGSYVEPGTPPDEVADALQTEVARQRDEVFLGPCRISQDHPSHGPGAELLSIL